MVILAWSIIVILFIFISNYYFYKTDSRTRKKAFLYAIIDFRPRKYPLLYTIIETIADLFTR